MLSFCDTIKDACAEELDPQRIQVMSWRPPEAEQVLGVLLTVRPTVIVAPVAAASGVVNELVINVRLAQIQWLESPATTRRPQREVH